jgi:hypothetical protein
MIAHLSVEESSGSKTEWQRWLDLNQRPTAYEAALACFTEFG